MPVVGHGNTTEYRVVNKMRTFDKGTISGLNKNHTLSKDPHESEVYDRTRFESRSDDLPSLW